MDTRLYVRLWSAEDMLPGWFSDSNIPQIEDNRTTQQPREIDVDKYVKDVRVRPYIEGRKESRVRGGYASLSNYKR